MPKPGQLPPQLLAVLANRQDYPLGALAYYGPDDHTCTRITAAVINAPNARPQFRHWWGESPETDPWVIAEIGEFFRLYRVREAVMTEGIIGCPHDEGIDYPEDEECPYCPFWNARQPSTIESTEA